MSHRCLFVCCFILRIELILTFLLIRSVILRQNKFLIKEFEFKLILRPIQLQMCFFRPRPYHAFGEPRGLVFRGAHILVCRPDFNVSGRPFVWRMPFEVWHARYWKAPVMRGPQGSSHHTDHNPALVLASFEPWPVSLENYCLILLLETEPVFIFRSGCPVTRTSGNGRILDTLSIDRNGVGSTAIVGVNSHFFGTSSVTLATFGVNACVEPTGGSSNECQYSVSAMWIHQRVYSL